MRNFEESSGFPQNPQEEGGIRNKGKRGKRVRIFEESSGFPQHPGEEGGIRNKGKIGTRVKNFEESLGFPQNPEEKSPIHLFSGNLGGYSVRACFFFF